MSQKQMLTQEGYEKLLKRLQDLKQEQKENTDALKDARGQGDLSENADYDAARDAQARIAAEIKEVEAVLKNYEIIVADDSNNLGKVVRIKFPDEEEESYKIVGSIEADPLNGKISQDSPLGKAVLNAKKGDFVFVRTEDGERFEVKVLDIKNVDSEKKKTTKGSKKN